ncbi:T9SS type A sorting domain-containing protein [Saccharicrinis sp. FJH54]|uniref:T9SS type A sorting domain-containing protein n=1 Tax=Saccharicrinis sp. FJH54 TaxID=3344665 RepID=UPI0035D400C2
MKKILFAICFLGLVRSSVYPQDYDRIIYVWDTITFEKPYEYLEVDTSSQNIWQIGQPQKSIFESAYSGKNVIVTDTVKSYPANNYSYFDIKIGRFNYPDYYPYDLFIEFKQKYDTDTLKDGGYITISYDNGKSWLNVFKDTSYFFNETPRSLYNGYYEYMTTKLTNEEIGFSGNSQSWQNIILAWYVLPAGLKTMKFDAMDTLIIRFNFISDSVDTGKEGWMIDDIKLYSVDLGNNIEYNDLKEIITIYPNPSSGILNIRLKAVYKKIQVDVYDLTGKMVLNEIFNDKYEVALSVNNLLPGTYIIKVNPDNEISALKYIVVQ